MNLTKFQTKQGDKSRDDLIKDLYDAYKKIERIEKEKERLEKELHKYKNAHTPSSQKRFEKIEVQGLKVGRKKGKKSGHKGRTRAKETPIKTIEVTADENPKTGNKNIEETGYIEEATITDFKIVKTVTKYNCHEYRDLDTGEIFIARYSDMPEKGIFGKKILALANYLRFKCRVPFDKIAFTFTHVFNIPMTAPTAMDICNRVADKVSPHYDKLKIDIQKEVNYKNGYI